MEYDPASFVKSFGIHSLVCCFSGGKDSLAATHFMLDAVREFEDLDRYVVWVDTTIALPGVREYVEETALAQHWPLVILKPEASFFQLASRWGMPRLRHRWCCYHLKLKPMIEFTKKLRPQRCEVTGLRRFESIRRSRMVQWFLTTGKTRTFKYAPIIDWTDEDVDRYISARGLKVNPVYPLIDTSGECICGVYTSIRKLQLIRGRWPSFFKQFLEVEKSFRSKGAAFYRKKPIRAEDLWAQETLDSCLSQLMTKDVANT